MTEVLQLLTVVAVGGALAAWGLYQGRREREAERRSQDERQQSIHFPEQRDDDQHSSVAMSRLS
jgi:hypothetical protein